MAMSHAEKVDWFLKEMQERGVHPATAAPPAWRTAWRMGLRVPPPHFMGFVPLALATGAFFGVLWGLAMAFLVWGAMGWLFSAGAALAAGALFGVMMAGYYRLSAARLGLPSWEEYPGNGREPPVAGPGAVLDEGADS